MKDKISFSKAVMMSINLMVGGGVLGGIPLMTAGAGAISFFGWILAALINLPVVLVIARMAEILPSEGGFSSYCKAGLGRFAGFYGGWLYFLGYACATASLLVVFGQTLALKFPSVVLFQNPYAFLLFAVTLLLGLNNLRYSTVASILSYLTLIKLIPILSAIFFLPFYLKLDLFTSATSADFAALPNVLTAAAFGFLGYEGCASMVDKIEGGAAKAKKAILVAFFVVTALYVTFHFSLINIMGVDDLVSKLPMSYPLFIMSRFPLLGQLLLVSVPVAVIVTFFNSSNGLFSHDTNALAGLSQERSVRFGSALLKQSVYDRPYLAVLIVALTVFALGAFVPDVKILMATTNFGVTLVFLMASISLFLADKRASLFQQIVNLFAIAILMCAISYHFFNAGTCMLERFQNMSVFLSAAVAGLFLYENCSACKE